MNLDVFPASHPDDFPKLSANQIRQRFVVKDLFRAGEARFAHTEYERLLIGGIAPLGGRIALPNLPALASDYFLQRRELGVVALSSDGQIFVDGVGYPMQAHDVLYVGRGSRNVEFVGDASFYVVSAPAHRTEPTTLSKREDAESVVFGESSKANVRTIRKHIHLDGVQSCQIALGVTTMSTGSVWNTMPPHIHERRTEIYFYFDLTDAVVQHTMGFPGYTNSMVVGNEDAVISPPWSIHTGAGTGPYSFVWATAGENTVYTDNIPVSVSELRS